MKKKYSKRFKKLLEISKEKKTLMIEDVISKVKKNCTTKFDESIDVSFLLNIKQKKEKLNLRTVVHLPNGNGKKVKVAVLCEESKVSEAKDSGADIVGAEELIEKVKNGEINFDKCIATPKMMSKVSVLGQILGPKGLMPNPKLGTVTNDLAAAIKNIKSGQVEYKTDKAGLIHAPVGKISFSDDELKKNIVFFLDELKKKKPENSKGVFIKKFFITSTMGPGLQVDSTSVM